MPIARDERPGRRSARDDQSAATCMLIAAWAIVTKQVFKLGERRPSHNVGFAEGKAVRPRRTPSPDRLSVTRQYRV